MRLVFKNQFEEHSRQNNLLTFSFKLRVLLSVFFFFLSLPRFPKFPLLDLYYTFKQKTPFLFFLFLSPPLLPTTLRDARGIKDPWSSTY